MNGAEWWLFVRLSEATRGQEGVELLELESHLQALYSPAGLAFCSVERFYHPADTVRQRSAILQ
eukprot:3700321-Amphidinium_carterae.1